MILAKIILAESRAAVSVTYEAVLDAFEDSVLLLSGLLHAERPRDLLAQLSAWVDDGGSAWSTWATQARPRSSASLSRRPPVPTLNCTPAGPHHHARRAPRTLERGNSLLKTTFAALRRWPGRPWCIGDIVAALVVLDHEHHRTT